MPALGGTFLSSHDPARLVQWFENALGIKMESGPDGGYVVFQDEASMATLSVQRAREGAPAPPKGDVEPEPYGRQTMMLNLRIDDMAATLARLKANGDDVAGPVDYEGMGKFAWTRTPDGHDIELWQR